MSRVHLATRTSMWWFGSVPDGGGGGRFDLPAPEGACYLAASLEVAVLEALGGFSGGTLPLSALENRRVSIARIPVGAPTAADLTARLAAGTGIGVSLWADGDRAATQHWAAELHGAGWQALYHGACHDPTGSGRALTVFDRAGEHPAWGDDWGEVRTLPLRSDRTIRMLAEYGVEVARPPTLELLDHPPGAI